MRMILPMLIGALVLLAIDYYAFQALQTVFTNKDSWFYKVNAVGYWLITFVIIASLLYIAVVGEHEVSRAFRITSGILMFLSVVSKLFLLFWLFGEDLFRIATFAWNKIGGHETVTHLPARRKLISQLAIVSAFIPLGTLAYGILRNAYRYQFHKVKVNLENLPAAFNGFKIVQLSDIHSGSFNQTAPIEKVIKEINALEPDLIVFTGDLVNDLASEMEDYIPIFSKLKAKYGIMSVTGNHDYGLYTYDKYDPKRLQNFEDFKKVHARMGWDLLMDEHRIIRKNNEELAILGVQNWGKANYFPKYGDLNKAIRGAENVPAKILLSHDPSHWEGQIIPSFPNVDLTLSGHTHGFQFGVETEHFKWSPSQYAYPQWAGLYRKGKQQLYVNRGFGFLGYPGRIGILPEVTVMELQQGEVV